MATTTLQTATSADGTTIAYEKLGAGPAVVLVCGGSVDRWSNAGLANVLASDFTVYNYDRRGRGDSGDTLPYAIEREIEDIAAVIDAAGGTAFLYGTSSGAALALDAAIALPRQGREARALGAALHRRPGGTTAGRHGRDVRAAGGRGPSERRRRVLHGQR